MADPLHEYSTRDILIEATSRRLWNEDESELRVLDICQETNLSTSVIYAHFRSRQGLIDASLLHIYAIVTDEIINYVETAAVRSRPTGSFVELLYEMLTDPEQEARVTRQRQMFFRVSATALSRPSLRAGFLALYEAYIARADAIFDDLLARGLVSDQLSSRQWVLFFEGQMLSRAFHDLSSDWNSQNDWLRGAHRMLSVALPDAVS